MELNDRIAFARKAAGLTQEQLGELAGVSRQAVSKWESGQTVPDALTVASLCEALHVSADFILLGKTPEDGQSAQTAYPMPESCPCCGRPISGTVCPICGYTLPGTPPRGPRYAIVASRLAFHSDEDRTSDLVKYCGYEEPRAQAEIAQMQSFGTRLLLRRGLTDSAALWAASHLDQSFFNLTIVEDRGEENDDALLTKPKAMDLPEPSKKEDGIGFWGVVLAVIVALLILSFF